MQCVTRGSNSEWCFTKGGTHVKLGSFLYSQLITVCRHWLWEHPTNHSLYIYTYIYVCVCSCTSDKNPLWYSIEKKPSTILCIIWSDLMRIYTVFYQGCNIYITYIHIYTYIYYVYVKRYIYYIMHEVIWYDMNVFDILSRI